jgi:hypothetical protein
MVTALSTGDDWTGSFDDVRERAKQQPKTFLVASE